MSKLNIVVMCRNSLSAIFITFLFISVSVADPTFEEQCSLLGGIFESETPSCIFTREQCLSIGGDFDEVDAACIIDINALFEDCQALGSGYVLENGICAKRVRKGGLWDELKCSEVGGSIHPEYGCVLD